MLKHWEHLKVVVGEDIDIYQQLARTKRSSAYTQNILSWASSRSRTTTRRWPR